MQPVQTIKRDFNLIRKIMLQIELSFVPGQHFHLPPYDDASVNLQVYFLKNEGMVNANCEKNQFTGKVDVAWIIDILPAGYDFLALIRDDNNWNVVMDNFTINHKEPTFKTLIYALEHIEESLYMKEQRALVAKQDEYTATIKKATVSSMIATWVMAAAIFVQIVISLLPSSQSTVLPISQSTSKTETSQVLKQSDSNQRIDTPTVKIHPRDTSKIRHPRGTSR